MFPVIALLITIQLVTLPLGVYGTLNHALIILLLFTISYLLVMLIKCGSLAVGRNNNHLKDSAPKRAREVETQIVVMTRIVQGMVWLLGLSGMAMTFPNAWQVGVSLLASASVSALLLGFAAKPSIEVIIRRTKRRKAVKERHRRGEQRPEYKQNINKELTRCVFWIFVL